MVNFKVNKHYAANTNDRGSSNLQATDSTVSSLSSGLTFSIMSPQSVAEKGINIDDTTVVLAPSSHNPRQAGDTLPATWPGVSAVIGSIRTFKYSIGTGGKTWVLWAVQNNIKVLMGLDLGSDSGASEIAAFVADFTAAGAALKTQYTNNIIGVAIGNEQTNVASINAGILNIKGQMTMGNIPTFPVTTVLEFTGQWIQNTFPPEAASFTAAFLTLSPNLDIICFNFYGDYFTFGNLPPLTPAEALQLGLSWSSNAEEFSVLLNQFGAVRSSMSKAGLGSLQLWGTETGWSSLKTQTETLTGWSSVPHLQTYYGNFLGFSLTMPFIPQDGTTEVLPPERIC